MFLFQVVGGGLPGVFQFEQFHFHWGSVDQRGSEHNINGVYSGCYSNHFFGLTIQFSKWIYNPIQIQH
jgi:hypothetical protein